MIEIYPFNAITPSSASSFYKTAFDIALSKKSIRDGFKACEEKVKYIINDLKMDFLFKKHNESFYCCRVSSESFSCIGLITLLQSSLIDKKIFRHERCIERKQEDYMDLFRKYNFQISPVTLIHEYNFRIKRNLTNVVTNEKPFLERSQNEYKYEFWYVKDVEFYQKLYRRIGALLIADGHHRISSLNALDPNKLAVVFLVSNQDVLSENIYREYDNMDPIFRKKLTALLNENLNLIPQALGEGSGFFNKFLCKIAGDIFSIDNEKKDILEFFSSFINHKNVKLSFYNYPCNDINKLSSTKKEVVLLIPALKIPDKIGKLPFLYPPHSTLLYPKIPDGLISANI
jgi:uncharacterized protein (DUF1015 family)